MQPRRTPAPPDTLCCSARLALCFYSERMSNGKDHALLLLSSLTSHRFEGLDGDSHDDVEKATYVGNDLPTGSLCCFSCEMLSEFVGSTMSSRTSSLAFVRWMDAYHHHSTAARRDFSFRNYLLSSSVCVCVCVLVTSSFTLLRY
jgi:hypothetical protein